MTWLHPFGHLTNKHKCTTRQAGKQANVTFLLDAAVVLAAAGVDVVAGHLSLAATLAHAIVLVVADPNSCGKEALGTKNRIRLLA